MTGPAGRSGSRRALFGLDRGFQLYDDRLPEGSEGWLERPAPQTTQAALAWIRSARAPWFAWVHYYDPHDPYSSPPEFLRAGPRGAHDGEAAFVDHAIGVLMQGLEAAASGPILTVFAADHGESLGEHGEPAHGFFVYDATVQVPVILHFPGPIPRARSPAPVRLVDIAPTILELLRQPPLEDVDGTSFVPLLLGRQQTMQPACIESLQPWISYGWAPLVAVRHGGWKLVDAPRPELYDLARDPGEEQDQSGQFPEKAAELRGLLQRCQEGAARGESRTSADPEAVASLQALGYVGGGGSTAPSSGLADPKDKLQIRNRRRRFRCG